METELSTKEMAQFISQYNFPFSAKEKILVDKAKLNSLSSNEKNDMIVLYWQVRGFLRAE